MNNIYQRSGKLLYQKYKEFFIPTILTSMATSMALIVDSIIVGNMLGAKEMASVSLCLPVLQLFATIEVLFGLGASILISIDKGKRDNESASRTYTASLVASFAISIVLTLLFLFFADTVCSILTQDKELLPMVTSYFKVLIWGTTLNICVPAMIYIIRTEGMAKLSSAVLIIANSVNLVLDILFMGPLQMGIAGSALATVCGFTAGSLVLFGYFLSKERTLSFSLRFVGETGKFIRTVWTIIKTGLPGCLGSVLLVLKILCLNHIVGAVAGSTGLIIFSVCISCLSLISMFIGGTAETMMPIVGTLYGERDFKGVRLILRYTFKVILVAICVVILYLEIAPASILAIFGVTDPAIVETGISSIRLYSISLLGVSITFLLLFYYSTVQQGGIANTLSIVEGFLVVIPCAWLLAPMMGLNGVWIAFILAEVVTLIVVYYQVRYLRKKSGGKYPDFLMIEDSDHAILYDVSLSGTTRDAVALSGEAIRVLRSNGIAADTALKTGISLEEMIINTQNYSRKKDKTVDIDLRISAGQDTVTLAMRDNGAYFNPTTYKMDENKDYQIDGITLMKAIVSEVVYNRVLALNQTIITIDKSNNSKI